MTPDYAALAQRLRLEAAAVELWSAQQDFPVAKRVADLLAAVSALDRMAAVEGALGDVLSERDADNDWLGSRGEPAREDTPALATARRAMEGDTK